MINAQELIILISGIISGIIIFQTAIVAPSVFKSLDPSQASPFLRSIFPKLFRVVSILGAIALVIIFVFKTGSISKYLIFTATLVLPLICGAIVPATNAARDAGNDKDFRILHAISVLLTMLVLILNLTWIFFI
ncbi:DUF4149 domain-containing protein [SAR86 cluster bacterium]|nr:DUF4149 domain-containing protein [SAR86 cluster bacterium]